MFGDYTKLVITQHRKGFYLYLVVISAYKVNIGWGIPCADHKSSFNWLDDLSSLSAHKLK